MPSRTIRGALPRVMQAHPRGHAAVRRRCRAALAQHYDTSGWKVQMVADGQTVPLGRRTLRFIETPMAHWPESMFTYVPEEKLLFSMDVFGQHYATAERFDEEVPADVLMEEAKTYYANILMPYGGGRAASRLAKLAGAGIGDDRAQPRRDLAAGRGAHRGRLSRLGRPAAGGQGAGALRHHVGEHRGRWPRRLPKGPRSRASRRGCFTSATPA